MIQSLPAYSCTMYLSTASGCPGSGSFSRFHFQGCSLTVLGKKLLSIIIIKSIIIIILMIKMIIIIRYICIIIIIRLSFHWIDSGGTGLEVVRSTRIVQVPSIAQIVWIVIDRYY